MTRQPITCDGSTIRLDACKCVAALLCVVIFPGCASLIGGALERSDPFLDPPELMRRAHAQVAGEGRHGEVIAGPEARGGGADSSSLVTFISDWDATPDTIRLAVSSIDSVWIHERADVVLSDGGWVEARSGSWCMARGADRSWRIVLDAGWSRWCSAPVDSALVLSPADVRSVKLHRLREAFLAADVVGLVVIITGVIVWLAFLNALHSLRFGPDFRIG